MKPKFNLLVVLGPTASGKTQLGVQLADRLGGEIISADSRQVYRGLNIGAGKDLHEYTLPHKQIAYHLIDQADLTQEFSVFHFQKAFYTAWEDCRVRAVWPILVGGTGLYLDAVLSKYSMVRVPENQALRESLTLLPDEVLIQRLQATGKKMHNITDTCTRDRIVRNLEIAEYERLHAPESSPDLYPLILGVRWERSQLRQRIARRLQERLQQGLIEEVEHLHTQGIPWERLQGLGLEYRFAADFLLGKWSTREAMAAKLYIAICQFAKRQETWFRHMERKGLVIHWVDGSQEKAGLEIAWKLIEETRHTSGYT